MGLRDIVLTLLLLMTIPLALARPFIGVLAFAWLSLMNPHRLTFGFAYSVSWAQYVAIATLIGFLVASDKKVQDSLARYKVALAFLAWTMFTTIFALADNAVPRMFEFTKIQLMCFVTLCLLTDRRRIEWFAIVATLSVAFFGIKGGIFTFLTGGNHLVWGPEGSVLGDNNQLAAALVMTIPLLVWLASYVPKRWQSLGVYAAAILTAFSVLGSHSRGAFVAGSAMGLFLILKSRHRGPAIMLVTVAIVAGVAFMPDSFVKRMESIGEYDQDESAQGRLAMWRAAINAANDRPTGGGFVAYESPKYAVYADARVRAPHSIYFQVLGEHGWIGLAIYLAFWISVWFQIRRAASEVAAIPDSENLVVLLKMIQVSLVGFAMGGAFVNIGYWDYPFDLVVITFAIRRLAAAHASVPMTGRAPIGRAGVGPFPSPSQRLR